MQRSLKENKGQSHRRFMTGRIIIATAVVCVIAVQLAFIGIYYNMYQAQQTALVNASRLQQRGPKYGPKRASIIQRLLAPTKPPKGTVPYAMLTEDEKEALRQQQGAVSKTSSLKLNLRSQLQSKQDEGAEQEEDNTHNNTVGSIKTDDTVTPPPPNFHLSQSDRDKPQGKTYWETVQENEAAKTSHKAVDRRFEKVYHNLLSPTYNVAEMGEMMKGLKLEDPYHTYGPCRAPLCDTIHDTIRAYNPWSKRVFLCGHGINPKSSIEVVDPCHEGLRVSYHEPAVLEHKVCFDSARQVTHPFVENIVEKHETDDHHEAARASEECKPGAFHPHVAHIGSWKRTVWYHDHVVDMLLEGTSGDGYRLSTGIDATAEMLRPNVYQMKDYKTRFTLIADPLILVSIKADGALILQTSHQSSQPKRFRVIVTDIDQPDGEKHTETMLSEFEHPVQFFKVLT